MRLAAGIVRMGAIVALSLLSPIPGLAAPPTIQASAALLMDADTGTVLYQKSARDSRPMASTTKVMTALLALEHADLDEDVTVSTIVNTITGSNAGLKPGDVVRMDDLLAALLVDSANDAAAVIAEHISGTVEGFADLMNSRAQQLGATDTHFVNPHGLYDPNHYASAYDLGLITCEAFAHDRFRQLVAAKVADVSLPSSPEGTVRIINHNKLLWRADFATGVKTGYVRQSGHCLIASGENNGWQLIAVLLDSPDMYAEAQALLQYGFASFDHHVYATPGDAVGRARVRGGRRSDVPAVCQKTLSCVSGPGVGEDSRLEVTLNTLDAPVSRGEPAGEAQLIAGGRVLASSPLIAGQDIPRSRLSTFALWLLRTIVLLLILVLLTRTYAKALKAHRRRRSRFPA